MTETSSLALDVVKFLVEPAARQDPYRLYRRLLSEDPVHRTPFETWIVSRYADASDLLEDHRFRVGIPPWGLNDSEKINAHLAGMMSMKDGAEHERIKILLSRFFTHRTAVESRGRIEAAIDTIFDELVGVERMDIMRDLAPELPARVSCALLGIPRPDWPQFQNWTETLTNEISREGRPPEELKSAEAAVDGFGEYLKHLVQQRRANPREDDPLSALAVAHGNGQIAEQELISSYMMLFISGRLTATHMIGNTILTLLRHRDHFERLRASRGLIRSAIEECLRYESPVRLVARIASDAIKFAGRTIAAGDVMVVLLGAANRDPAQFKDPDRFDISRTNNCHIAFGRGIHACLGRALGTVEGEVVINRLLDRFKNIELLVKEAEIKWSDSIALRCLEALPIAFQPH